uniref:Mariner Mos1 transposase n=1 Tax=Strongyloides venezuelensis TaxID=75913 RepID=A0A0K0G1C1_STRVS
MGKRVNFQTHNTSVVWEYPRGNFDLDDEEGRERLTITNTEYLQKIVESNSKQSQKDMAKELGKIRPVLTNRSSPIVLHANARCHASKKSLKKLCKLNYKILLHPFYSPDLSTTDYYLSKHLDAFLKDKLFINQKSAEEAFTDFIKF